MGLSIASLNPISNVTMVTPKEQAYSISNQSAVSQAYKDSINNTVTPKAVRGPAPVQYATSRYDVSSVSGIQANRRMTRAYNDIASGFNGVNTSYDRNSQASSYDTIGQSVDLFA